MDRTADGEHSYWEHGRAHARPEPPSTTTSTERATAKLYLPDGSALLVDIDPRPPVGFHRRP